MMATAAIGSSPMPPSPNSNKRKRGTAEHDAGRSKIAHTNNTDAQSDLSFFQAMQDGMQNEANAQTAQAALATPMQHAGYPDAFDTNSSLPAYDEATGPSTVMGTPTTAQQVYEARQAQANNKPSVGTQAWHQQRKDNHKEVERRRREVINEGIENISKIVPGTEKNKGAILARTCSYVQELQTTIKSFDNERAVFDSTLQELTSRYESMKRDAERAWSESAKWQQRCRDAGLSFEDYDAGLDGTAGHGVDDFSAGNDADGAV